MVHNYLFVNTIAHKLSVNKVNKYYYIVKHIFKWIFVVLAKFVNNFDK